MSPPAPDPEADEEKTSAVSAEGRHLLSIADLGAEGIEEVLRVSDAFVEVAQRPIPKVPALRGRTVVTLFAEESTRTRFSFETAAKRLSADVLSFAVASSSLKKGESLRDTVETVAAMGVDAFIIRHPSAGAPAQVARWVDASVINAGDGWHEHPTQALLDCYTIRQALAERAGRSVAEAGMEAFQGLRVAIVGDIAHSRVARSGVLALSALGAEITLVAPGSLLPPSLGGWPVAGVSHDLDAVLPGVDVCYLLRLQTERGAGSFLPVAARVHRRLRPDGPAGRPSRPGRSGHAPGADEPRGRDRRRGGRSPAVVGAATGGQRRGRAHGRPLPPARPSGRERRPRDRGRPESGGGWSRWLSTAGIRDRRSTSG